MSTTGSRTLQLLSLLQNHRYWPGDELAGRLQVSVRTLRRDVDRLRELGYPVHSNRGVDGGYHLEAGAAMPPLLLDDDEAVGLTVALQTAASQSITGVAESALRALAKLTRVMPPRLRRQVDALRDTVHASSWTSPAPGPATESSLLVAIALMCRDSERMRFHYVPPTGESSGRHVEPLRLVSLGRRWYLVAFDLDRQDWRTFRTDRIDSPLGTGIRFTPRELPGGDPVAFVREGIVRSLPLVEVEVLVGASADVVRAQVGRWATVHAIDAARCRLLMQVDSLNWTVFALGSLGVEFQVVEPVGLLPVLTDWADRFARAVAAGTPPRPPAPAT
jgi:predicted DNA-binding transcriptional regulator YafY